MTGRLLTLVVLLAAVACGPVSTVRPDADNLANVRRVAVLVVEDGGFMVIKERAKATATGFALFGVVGAAVSSMANRTMDSGEADKVRPGLAGFSPTSVLRESFVETLKSSGRVAVDVADSEAGLQALTGHDAIVRLTIKEWGVRLPNPSISDQMAAFVAVQARMSRVGSQDMLWDEHEVALGRGRHELSQYQSDATLLRNELTETVHDAGYRLANHLIYPREKGR